MPEKKPSRCAEIRSQIQKWDDQWKQNHKVYYDMTDFVMGDQWREDESKLFERYNKMPLTANKLAPLMNYLGGQQRQNTPTLDAVAIGEVDEELLEVRTALIRDISFNSDTEVIYQNNFQRAGIGGFAAMWVGTEYENNESFQQVIKVMDIRDPCQAYFDLGAVTEGKTDGMHSGFKIRTSRKKFASVWGDDIERSIGSAAIDDQAVAFFDDDSITVINHFWRETKKKRLYELSNGETITRKEFSKLLKVTLEEKDYALFEGEPVTIVRRRDIYEDTIYHGQYAGDWELEVTKAKTTSMLPVVYTDQNSYWDKDGRQVTRPILKDAKDAQRFINYLFTQSAYLIKISRYDQFIASKKNVQSADTQVIWRDPENVQGALIYDESPSGAKPEQLRPPELSPSLIQQYQQALLDIQTSTGIYGTQLGAQGNEVSGDAIDSRGKRGDFSNYIPFNSLNRAISCVGEVINEMIPKVYDSKRLVKLSMPDQNSKDVTLNNPVDDYGNQIENDMTIGQYKIKLLPGASFEDQKVEALQAFDRVLAKNPAVFNMIADLYAENLPIQNNIQVRNRLRTMVDPKIIEAGKTGKALPQSKQPSPEQMAQMQEFQIKQAQLQQKSQELQQKQNQSQQDYQLELAKLQHQQQELAAQVQDATLRYSGEIHRTNVDARIAHSQNLTDILTSKPHANESSRD